MNTRLKGLDFIAWVGPEEPRNNFNQASDLIFLYHSSNRVWEAKKSGFISSFIHQVYIEHGRVLGAGTQQWAEQT